MARCPLQCTRIAVRGLLRGGNRSPAHRCFPGANRPDSGNDSGSFGGCLHRPPTLPIRTHFAQTPSRETESIERTGWASRLRSAHCGAGARGGRRQPRNPRGCRSAGTARPAPRHSALLRAAPRSGFPRPPAPRGRARPAGHLGELGPRSP